MKTIHQNTSIMRLAIMLALGAGASVAMATPYATSLTNDAGTVSFRLNESADLVTILGNAGTLSSDLGPTAAGLTVTNLTTSGLTGGVFQVVVRKSGLNVIAGYATNSMNSPRGLVVNRNPASPYFGRVYVANSAAGGTGANARNAGLYLYHPDLSVNPIDGTTNYRTAGYDFVTGGVGTPFRITVGPDDQVYIADWSDATGNLIVTDPDVTSFQYVLKQLEGTAALPVGSNNNHGSVQAVAVSGSIATGDLKIYTVDEDYAQDPTSTILNQWNSLWEYNIGAGPLPWANPPDRLLMVPHINFLSQNDDVALGPNGLLYFNQRRANSALATWTPSLFVVDPNNYIDPTNYADFYNPALTNWTGFQSNIYSHEFSGSGGFIWESQTATHVASGGTQADRFQDINGVAISPDGRYLASITWGQNPAANTIIIAPLTNGIPDLTRIFTISTGTTAAGRGVAWDAANNIYMISSGLATVRGYSLNYNSVATTGSDGTFSLEVPADVWVSAPDPVAVESTPVTDTGTFTFYRDGDTSAALTVNYTIAGTAENGVDYVSIPTSVTFAPGDSSTNVVIVPIDDTTAESPETVTLTIVPSQDYTSLYSKAATVTIIDNESAEIVIQPLGANTNMYERVYNDFTRFQIVRRGDTNSSFFVNLDYGGLINGVDLLGPASVALDAGASTANFDVNPIDNSDVTGTRTFTVFVQPASGGEYVIGTPNTASGNIIDDDLPSEAGSVLWSEDFESPSPGPNVVPANWKFAFIATNGVPDYDFTFGYDYAGFGIPPAPGAVSTMGLYATVNKSDSAAFAAALNFYPVGQSFTNNFAFRFNMLLIVNTAAGQTEHAIFGINHSGTTTNWFNSSGTVLNGTSQDGLWFSANSSGGNLNDNTLFTRGTTVTAPRTITNRAASTLTYVFKNPPYFAAGTPGISQTTAGGLTWTWIDVEIAHTTNMVVLRYNNNVIIQTTNLTEFNSGNVMLGYNDAFNSIGSLGGAVIYDNARVVSITPPVISAQPVGGGSFAGSTVVLSVTAATTTGITNYQWFRNGVALAGETGATLTIADFQAANTGSYTVLVDDGRYPVMSQPAVLTVSVAPMLGISLDGTTVNLTFDSASGATYTVQYKNSLSDATWSTLASQPGTGSPITVPDNNPFASTATRYYQLVVQ